MFNVLPAVQFEAKNVTQFRGGEGKKFKWEQQQFSDFQQLCSDTKRKNHKKSREI